MTQAALRRIDLGLVIFRVFDQRSAKILVAYRAEGERHRVVVATVTVEARSCRGHVTATMTAVA